MSLIDKQTFIQAVEVLIQNQPEVEGTVKFNMTHVLTDIILSRVLFHICVFLT